MVSNLYINPRKCQQRVFFKLFLNFSSEYITRHSETDSIPHQHVWIHKLSLRIQHLQHGFSLWRAAIWICFRYAKSCDVLLRRDLSTSISGSITQCWYLILAEWHVVTIGHSCHSCHHSQGSKTEAPNFKWALSINNLMVSQLSWISKTANWNTMEERLRDDNPRVETLSFAVFLHPPRIMIDQLTRLAFPCRWTKMLPAAARLRVLMCFAKLCSEKSCSDVIKTYKNII